MIIKERYPHAVSASFESVARARDKMQALRDRFGFRPQQVRLVKPDDRNVSRKVEPESRKIFSTLLNAHLWTALAGFSIGVALAAVMVAFGPNWARSNPLFTVLAFAWVGTLGTALLGGLVTLRPDRDGVSIAAREASRNGEWTVIAHCRDRNEKDVALHHLEHGSLSTQQSL